MAGPLKLSAVVLAGLMLSSLANAFGPIGFSPSCCSTFVPSPVVLSFYAPKPCVPWAIPSPAPPSDGPTTWNSPLHLEPPLAKPPFVPTPPAGKGRQGPIINHYRSIGSLVQTPEARQSLAKVTFWNLTGSEVVVTINDRAQTIAADRAVAVDLDRTFSWKSNRQFTPKTEHVPDDVNFFEVLVK